MMSLVKNTQNITKGVFVFVPKLNMDEEWTDEKLYKKYKLKQDEIDFIATIVKKMDSSDE
jgi:site-specific DNA-methyltransferase (adenine-specific)